MASAVVETAGPAPELERREILRALRLLRRGDFSVRLPLDLDGIDGEIACAFNEVVELNDAMTREVERVSAMVGREGLISDDDLRGLAEAIEHDGDLAKSGYGEGLLRFLQFED